MMTSTGTLTLGRLQPFGHTASDGTFVLTLLAHDRINLSTKTAWRLTYAGEQAATFWHAHKDALQPGTSLHVVAGRIWSFGNNQTGRTEVHATVLEMSLSGHAQSIKQNQQLAGDLIALAV